MGIFRKQDIDLSDEALTIAAETSNEITSGSAADESYASENEESNLPAQDGQEQAEAEPSSSAGFLDTETKAEREAQWQAAKETISGQWPQAMGEGEMLISKMVEIGTRYGDPQLWQRSPEGIMREAAIEIFGLPKERDNGYARIAAEAAREAALKEMGIRNQAKLGLNKKRSKQAPPPPLTEEEKIVAAIAKARNGSIF